MASMARLTDEQRALVEANIGLAAMVAWKYRTSCAQYGMDWDDVFSIACLGLMRAARSFNPEVSKPSTYLTIGCETAVCEELRKHKTKSRSTYLTISIEDVLCVDGQGHELTLADVLKSEEPTIEETVLSRLAVEQLPTVLGARASATEKDVLLRRINGMKQREIAEALCLSQSYVSRILTGIKNKIQRTLAA